jgi:ABC-type branched-subunit amino acid transport system ATPase component
MVLPARLFLEMSEHLMFGDVRAFRAEKILGDETYELSLEADATIIVGPNGTGKSTLLNVFYLFITRQWARLLQYNFSKLTLQLSNREISITRADLFTADSALFSKVTPRFRNIIQKLGETQSIGHFIATPNMSFGETVRLANLLELPVDDVQTVRQYLSRQSKDLFEDTFLDVDRQLAELDLPKVLYPSIFPVAIRRGAGHRYRRR